MPGGFQLKAEVLAHSACSLCGACLDWCPYLKNIEDHLVMTFDCSVQEGRCYATCPRTLTDWEAIRYNLLDHEPAGIEVGTVKGLFKVKATAGAAAKQDGGTVTALVKTALSEGKAEAALLTGSKEAFTPTAILAEDLEQVEKEAGSRFLAAPSMRGLVEAGSRGIKKLVVVGRPCQIQAVRKMQFNRPTELSSDGVITIGLFCMWSLSWSFKRLIQEKLPGCRIIHVSIPQHGLEVVTDQGTLVIATEEVRSYISQGCRYCTDMTSELADISVGALEVDPGWNTVIVRSQRGMKLFETACSKGNLVVEEYPASEFQRLQQASFNKKLRGLRNLDESAKTEGLISYIDLAQDPYKKILTCAEGEVSR